MGGCIRKSRALSGPTVALRGRVPPPTRKRHRKITKNTLESISLARPERFELPTSWFVARHSIQLSYGRAAEGIVAGLESEGPPGRIFGAAILSQ